MLRNILRELNVKSIIKDALLWTCRCLFACTVVCIWIENGWFPQGNPVKVEVTNDIFWNIYHVMFSVAICLIFLKGLTGGYKVLYTEHKTITTFTGKASIVVDGQKKGERK